MFRYEKNCGRRKRGEFFINLFAVIWGTFFLFSCAHIPGENPLDPKVEKSTQVFEAPEKIIIRAIKHVSKERGFGEAKVEKVGEDESRLKTEYVFEGDLRNRMEAIIKKISRKEREVTLIVTTEQRDSGPTGWKPKRLLGKEQYEKIFGEIDMQIYREWGKGE